MRFLKEVMNSKAGASHVGKQLFFEDEYIAFKIALDMNNIDEFKSKKEDLKLYQELKTKIMRNKNTLTDKNSNVEKGTKDKNTKAKRRTLTRTEGDNENIEFRTDMKENARFRSDKDSALKENQSTGAIKKKINQKKTKKTDHRHTSVTDATNTIHSGSNDVREKVNKSKDARMLVEKKKLLGQEAEKMSAEASKKKRTRNIKKSENILNNVNDPGKEFNGGTENQKSKVKLQVQLKENKNSIKQKKNIQAEEKSSNVSDVKEKDLPKEKGSEKKKKESKEKRQDVVGEKTSVKKSRLGKINENIPEIDGKDFIENKADVKEKKTRVKKAMPLEEGEEKTSKSRVKEKDAGNNETETKRSRNKRTKAGEKNGEKVVDQKKESPRKKSENCKTGKNSSAEGIKNIDSDNELVKTNAPNTQTEIPKTINYNSEEANKLPINLNFKKENLSPKNPLELIKPVTLENIDEAVLKKLNVVSNNLKNEECDFQDKSFEKKKKNDSVNDKPLDDLKKYTVRALDGMYSNFYTFLLL